jgi:hypothetical protein
MSIGSSPQSVTNTSAVHNSAVSFVSKAKSLERPYFEHDSRQAQTIEPMFSFSIIKQEIENEKLSKAREVLEQAKSRKRK